LILPSLVFFVPFWHPGDYSYNWGLIPMQAVIESCTSVIDS